MGVQKRIKIRTCLLKIGIKEVSVMEYTSRVFEVNIPANMTKTSVLKEVVRRLQVKEE